MRALVWITLLIIPYYVDKATFAVRKALLIFARQPMPGKVKTRLSPPLSAGDAAELYRCMLEDVLDKTAPMREVERLLFYDPEDGADAFFRETCPDLQRFPQQGAGLGERLVHAFDRVFALGYGAAAAIGTDSPDLPSVRVGEAFSCLEEGMADVVFGPASDGGYYLVAMRKSHHGLFREIPWSTAQVLEKSERNALAAGLATVRLEAWHDLDTAADLRRLMREANPDGADRTIRFLREHAGEISFNSQDRPEVRGNNPGI
jgi:rSAM/selenodomain-associated transferase 1